MIDTVVQVDRYKLAIEAIIAEGGFGYVYRARDLSQSSPSTGSNTIYALKKINSTDKDSQREIENEIDILIKLQKHPHILKFIASSKSSDQQQQSNENCSHSQQYQNTKNAQQQNNHNNGTGLVTYFILTEYCSRGTLTDLDLPIQETERSCRIIYQISQALKHIHSLGIIHRDIKAENILFNSNGRVKICDFGSATTSKYEPDINWTPLQRSTVEDEMQRHTTPLYRPPEILETYLHYPIDCAIDIWALGCLTYFIRFGQHAFPDSGKLNIINCCYKIPKDVNQCDPLVSIIKKCLEQNPCDRITIEALIDSLEHGFPDMELDGDIVPYTASKKQSQPIEPAPMVEAQLDTPKKVKPPVPETNVEPLSDDQPVLIDTNERQEKTRKFEKLFDMDFLEPSKKVENVENLLDMDIIANNQEILSPKKTIHTNGKRDPFDDLLETFGCSLPSNGSSSNLQGHNLIDSSLTYDGFGIDPKLKIQEWKKTRRGNIRALLSSLHLVLSEEFKWKPIGMHQLVTDNDVKKIYRLACLAIHPDKMAGREDDTRAVAEMIFVELNEAWAKFEGK